MSRTSAKGPRVDAVPADPPLPESVAVPASTPAPKATRKPRSKPAVGEKNQPNAKKGYITWGSRITSTHKGQLAAMIETAPRHVTMQTLVCYILTEFFRQHPELPEELRQPTSSNRPPRS